MTCPNCVEAKQPWERRQRSAQQAAGKFSDAAHYAKPATERDHYKASEETQQRIGTRPRISNESTGDASAGEQSEGDDPFVQAEPSFSAARR